MNVELGSVEFIIIIIFYYYILFPSGAGPELPFQSWTHEVALPGLGRGAELVALAVTDASPGRGLPTDPAELPQQG